MKKYRIFLDVGTSNSRVYIIDESSTLTACEKAPTGAGSTTVTGNNEKLKQTLKSLLEKALQSAGLTFADILYIVSYGMIGSELGLKETPYCQGPANARLLAKHTESISLPEIAPLPIHIIPGIKTQPPDSQTPLDSDIMRGEEVAALGILSALPSSKQHTRLIILPGTHTKFVLADSPHEITHSATSITGELLTALTQHTILAPILNHGYPQDPAHYLSYIRQGHDSYQKYGFGRACFLARMLYKLYDYKKEQLACYLLGAVLGNDITALCNMVSRLSTTKLQIIITGKEPFLTGLQHLLLYAHAFPGCEIIALPISSVPYSVSGAAVVMSHFRKDV